MNIEKLLMSESAEDRDLGVIYLVKSKGEVWCRENLNQAVRYYKTPSCMRELQYDNRCIWTFQNWGVLIGNLYYEYIPPHRLNSYKHLQFKEFEL